MADAIIYKKLKEKESTVGLTESEAFKLEIVGKCLFDYLDSLEMAVIEGVATVTDKRLMNYLRTLLLTKAVVR